MRRTTYLWERPGWPNLRWTEARLLEPLAAARLRQGRLLGSMARLGFPSRAEAQLDALTEDVVESSAIEGETLDRDTVRSSIARRLGVTAAFHPADRRTQAVVDMVLDATADHRSRGGGGDAAPAGRRGPPYAESPGKCRAEVTRDYM